MGYESHRFQIVSYLDRVCDIKHYDTHGFGFQSDRIRIGSAANRFVFGRCPFAIGPLLKQIRNQTNPKRIRYERDRACMESNLDLIYFGTNVDLIGYASHLFQT